jgi:hypothetical protein
VPLLAVQCRPECDHSMDLARSRLPSEGRMPAGTMIVSPCLATRSSPSRVTCASHKPLLLVRVNVLSEDAAGNAAPVEAGKFSVGVLAEGGELGPLAGRRIEERPRPNHEPIILRNRRLMPPQLAIPSRTSRNCESSPPPGSGRGTRPAHRLSRMAFANRAAVLAGQQARLRTLARWRNGRTGARCSRSRSRSACTPLPS